MSLVNSFAVGLGRSPLSVEVRVGASRLWRGLSCADIEFRAADLAASALASLSWRRSLVRAVEAVLEGAVGNRRGQKSHGLRRISVDGEKDILGLCLAGEAGLAGLPSFCCCTAPPAPPVPPAPSSFSARMLSSRASTPATAWEINEPQRAAIAWRRTEMRGRETQWVGH